MPQPKNNNWRQTDSQYLLFDLTLLTSHHLLSKGVKENLNKEIWLKSDWRNERD